MFENWCIVSPRLSKSIDTSSLPNERKRGWWKSWNFISMLIILKSFYIIKKSNLLGNHHKKSCDLGRFISGLIFVGLFPVCFHCIDWMMWQKDSNKGACKLERYDVSVYQSDFHFKRGCWEKSSALSITIFVPIYKSNWLINKINSRIYKHKHFTNIKLLKWYRADRFRWQRHKCFQRWSITSSFIHRQQFFTNTWYYLLHSYTLAR